MLRSPDSEVPERASALEEFRRFSFHAAATEHLLGMEADQAARKAAYTKNVCSRLRIMDAPEMAPGKAQ